MILLIIIVATVLSFITWMYIPKQPIRYLLGTLSLLSLLASTLYLTDHFVNHRGMTVDTKVTKQEIYSAGDVKANFGLLITQKIGRQSNHHILIYRDHKADQKPRAHFVPNKKKINEAIKISANYKQVGSDKAYLITTTKRYVWKTHFDKLMFGFGGENNELISQKAEAIIPKDYWLVLTPKQAQQLTRLAPQLKADQEKALKANPQIAFKMHVLAKENPKALSKLQVEQLKKALRITD
ncbi:DUF4811 domain-containing protein [Streptococcus pseudoporcinus]|uniref:DUF4811 domain-containing protein n=1 Tax=Streptococcus pseudoporcinus LQ 940-04 TaxID=875093 RepID=G5K898_9STRE|nr:DUF4811 domain-containing protein [Streptococcus pseudoporcinus]EFR44860.1 hypothetical protein HMPREF9320_1018 [Streptococcus pseudoporcinus SPIN 20026]EHI64215.1 hypothetical protein STRPS_1171 [Streptococcus pseudoporcinus LQ 940-04]VEF94042.1 membrane protein [Streptococcus pseudoporcinus]